MEEVSNKFSTNYFKFIFSKLFTFASLKFFLLILIMALSGFILASGKIPLNPENLQLWIEEKGILGPIVLIAINNIAIFNPFIPNQIIHITAGALYGPVIAFLIIYPASLAGWSFNYYLGRKLGRHFVEEMIGTHNLSKVDDFVSKAKLRDFLILIFTPGMSYDTLAYIAGVVRANFKDFLLGGVIGSILPTAISVWVGAITIKEPWIGISLTLVGIAFSIIYGYSVFKRKK